MRNYKLRRLLFVGLLALLAQQTLRGQDAKFTSIVDFCDLIKSGGNYDNREISVRATFRYGFEWQEIYCLKCRDSEKVWLEVDDYLLTKSARKVLRRFPKDGGTVNAVFMGRFERSGGPFGDGSYRSRLVLVSLVDAELVTKSGGDPRSLPTRIRRKVCGGEESATGVTSVPAIRFQYGCSRPVLQLPYSRARIALLSSFRK